MVEKALETGLEYSFKVKNLRLNSPGSSTSVARVNFKCRFQVYDQACSELVLKNVSSTKIIKQRDSLRSVDSKIEDLLAVVRKLKSDQEIKNNIIDEDTIVKKLFEKISKSQINSKVSKTVAQETAEETIRYHPDEDVNYDIGKAFFKKISNENPVSKAKCVLISSAMTMIAMIKSSLEK